MTDSETKFRRTLKTLLKDPDAYILKIPDYKQTGGTALRGMPDYLVISRGSTAWFEVKMTPSPTTFNFNAISENQYTVFEQMRKAGAKIYIAVYMGESMTLEIIDYSIIAIKKLLANEKSMTVEEIRKTASQIKYWCLDGRNN